MQNRDVLKHHADLMDRMATRAGVDLEEATLRGDMPMEKIADAVLSCTNCSAPEACATVLANAKDRSDRVPSYCRNKSLFDALRP